MYAKTKVPVVVVVVVVVVVLFAVWCCMLRFVVFTVVTILPELLSFSLLPRSFHCVVCWRSNWVSRHVFSSLWLLSNLLFLSVLLHLLCHIDRPHNVLLLIFRLIVVIAGCCKNVLRFRDVRMPLSTDDAVSSTVSFHACFAPASCLSPPHLPAWNFGMIESSYCCCVWSSFFLFAVIIGSISCRETFWIFRCGLHPAHCRVACWS
jgi:hypothetical protein